MSVAGSDMFSSTQTSTLLSSSSSPSRNILSGKNDGEGWVMVTTTTMMMMTMTMMIMTLTMVFIYLHRLTSDTAWIADVNRQQHSNMENTIATEGNTTFDSNERCL